MEYTLVDGMLSIKDALGNEIILEELPMAQYEKFYKHWQVAIGSTEGTQLDFTTAYCTSNVFRTHVLAALAVLGIAFPDHLKPRTMQALLVSHNDGPGLAFQLHGEIPKVIPGMVAPVIQEAPEAPKVDSMNSGSPVNPTPMPRRFLSSIWGGLQHIKLWVMQALYPVGLSVAYCGI